MVPEYEASKLWMRWDDSVRAACTPMDVADLLPRTKLPFCHKLRIGLTLLYVAKSTALLWKTVFIWKFAYLLIGLKQLLFFCFLLRYFHWRENGENTFMKSISPRLWTINMRAEASVLPQLIVIIVEGAMRRPALIFLFLFYFGKHTVFSVVFTSFAAKRSPCSLWAPCRTHKDADESAGICKNLQPPGNPVQVILPGNLTAKSIEFLAQLGCTMFCGRLCPGRLMRSPWSPAQFRIDPAVFLPIYSITFFLSRRSFRITSITGRNGGNLQ